MLENEFVRWADDIDPFNYGSYHLNTAAKEEGYELSHYGPALWQLAQSVHQQEIEACWNASSLNGATTTI